MHTHARTHAHTHTHTHTRGQTEVIEALMPLQKLRLRPLGFMRAVAVAAVIFISIAALLTRETANDPVSVTTATTTATAASASSIAATMPVAADTLVTQTPGDSQLHSRPESALVDSEWLRVAQEAGKPALLVLDCNDPEVFARSHIPQAVLFTAAASRFKDPTPGATGAIGKDAFERIVAQLRVPRDATLVFYDDQMSSRATRAWWVFRHFGFPAEQLKVLDGGLKHWMERRNKVATGEPASATPAMPQQPTGTLWSVGDAPDTHALVGLDVVLRAIDDPETQLVDARSLAEFSGEDARGNARAGHVPGAVNFSSMDAMGECREQFKSKAQLDAILLDALQLDKDKAVIVYCQSGIRAAHAAFALSQVVGFKHVQIYEDSMSQYLNLPDSEVETASAPSQL